MTSHAAYERSDGPSKRPAAKRPCIYILFLPDAKRPPSLRIAHTGTRYEILDLRDSFGAGTRNSACSSGRCSSGMGPQSTPFWRRARLALAPRRFAGHPRRSLFAGWALPERNVFGGWHRWEDPSRKACYKLFSVMEDQSLCTPVSLYDRNIRCFRDRTAASSRIHNGSL